MRIVRCMDECRIQWAPRGILLHRGPFSIAHRTKLMHYLMRLGTTTVGAIGQSRVPDWRQRGQARKEGDQSACLDRCTGVTFLSGPAMSPTTPVTIVFPRLQQRLALPRPFCHCAHHAFLSLSLSGFFGLLSTSSIAGTLFETEYRFDLQDS